MFQKRDHQQGVKQPSVIREWYNGQVRKKNDQIKDFKKFFNIINKNLRFYFN